MASLGRGRAWGRGRGNIDMKCAVEPLRQPGMFVATSTESKIGVSRLAHLLDGLSLSNDGRLVGLLEIKNTLQNDCLRENDFAKAVKAVHMYGLKSKLHAEIAALVCKEFANFECSGLKFKSLLLDLLFQDYQDREILCADTEKFVNCVTFLCEVLHNVRLQNNAVINVIPGPVYVYFDMLVDGGSDIEIETLSNQLKKNGKDLTNWNSEKMYELLIKIRRKIISSSCSVRSRSLLLNALELALTLWYPLTPGVKAMYESFLRPVFPHDK